MSWEPDEDPDAWKQGVDDPLGLEAVDRVLAVEKKEAILAAAVQEDGDLRVVVVEGLSPITRALVVGLLLASIGGIWTLLHRTQQTGSPTIEVYRRTFDGR